MIHDPIGNRLSREVFTIPVIAIMCEQYPYSSGIFDKGFGIKFASLEGF